MEGEEGLLKDARRLLAINTGEQKRLEKLQRYIEKKRKEKERKLTRAQEDAVYKWYETSKRGANEFLCIEKSFNGADKSRMKVVTSGEINQGHKIISDDNKEKPKQQHQKLTLHERSTKNVLPGLELAVYGLKVNYSMERERSRSLSNLTDKGTVEIDKKEEEQEEKKDRNKQDSSMDIKFNYKKSVKPLSAILPPLVLPPLHKQRRPSLQEQTKNYYKTEMFNDTRSFKEHYDDLSDCRYLRVYKPKKGF